MAIYKRFNKKYEFRFSSSFLLSILCQFKHGNVNEMYISFFLSLHFASAAKGEYLFKNALTNVNKAVKTEQVKYFTWHIFTLVR